VAIFASACYVTLGTLFRRRLPGDGRSVFGAVCLAVVFATLAVPLHLELEGITLAWAVEGPVLLWLGYRFSYGPVRVFGFGVLVLTLIRLFAVDWPVHDESFVPFLNARFGSAAFVPAASAAFAFVARTFRDRSTPLDRGLGVTAGIISGLLALGIVHFETAQALDQAGAETLALAAGPVLWAVSGVLFVLAGMRRRVLAVRVVGLVVLAGALMQILPVYGSEWSLRAGLFVINARFGGALTAVLAIFAAAAIYRRTSPEAVAEARGIVSPLVGVGLAVLLATISTEIWVHFTSSIADPEEARWTAQMGLSIAWALYSMILLALGFARRIRPLRLAALGLFGVTALKAVLVDLAVLQQAYRIIAFLVLGLLLIGASWAYHRAEKRLSAPSGDPEEGGR
jgi:uncharacterized membrane protein